MGKIIHELKKVSGMLIFPMLISKKETYPGRQPRDTSEKILIFKDDSLGDFLLFSGIFNFYRRHFKDRVYCVVDNNIEEVVKLYTDKVISINKKEYFASFKYRYAFINQLHDIGFDTAISSILNSSESRDILYILKTPKTYLYGGVVMELKKQRRWKNIANIIPALNMFEDNGMYTKILSHEKHYTERILNVKVSDDEVKPHIPLTDAISEAAVNKFSLTNGNYFVFSFSSRSLKKNYPVDKFVEIIKHLHGKLVNINAVLIGNEHDSVKLPDFVADLRGKTSLIDAFSIIKHARFFIGNETGTAHASWIMGVPTVIIYGGGHFGGFIPEYDSGHIVYKYMDCYCCNWGCKYTDIPVPCIKEISVSDIIKAAEKVLS